MKLAVSPEIAVRLGSASVRITPARSMALNTAVMFGFTPKLEARAESGEAPDATKGLTLLKRTLALPYCRLAETSTPSCFRTSRFTSATFTLSMTWSRPRTEMLLTTFASLPTNREATSKPRCARRSTRRSLRLVGTCCSAGQHNGVANALNADVRVREHLLDRGARPVEIACYRDIEACDLLTRGVEKEHISLPDRNGDHINAASATNDRICDLRIADQHVLHVCGQIDSNRFTNAKPDGARGRIACGNLDYLHRYICADR